MTGYRKNNVKDYIRFNSLINVDFIRLTKNVNKTLEEAREEQKNKVDSASNSNTIFYTAYDEPAGLSGGIILYSILANYFDAIGVDTSLSVYKKTPRDLIYTFVCTFTDGTFKFTDYNVKNNEYYHYLIAIGIPVGKGENDETMYSYNLYENINLQDNMPQYIKASWNGWSICDIEQSVDDENVYIKTGNIWNLKYNITEEQLTLNLSITNWNTLGRYPKISLGKLNYDSSTFTGLLGLIEEYKVYETARDIRYHIYKTLDGYTERENLDSPYSKEVDKLERWKEFCANGKLKLLKDGKGNSWIIQIVGTPSNNIDVQSNIQETMITFEWMEVLDINSVNIVGSTAFTEKKEEYNDIWFEAWYDRYSKITNT